LFGWAFGGLGMGADDGESQEAREGLVHQVLGDVFHG
jgi:hypothetical protein